VDSTDDQSTGCPERIDAAISSNRASRSTPHFLRQLDERATGSAASRIGAGTSRGLGHLFRRVPELHRGDDQLAIGVAEPREGGFVAFHGLTPYGLLQRRRLMVLVLRIELGRHRPPVDPTDVIANAVQHRLAQVGLERPLAADLERLQVLKRLEHRFLDNVMGVGEVAGPARQSSAGPAEQRRHAPGEEVVDGRAVACSGPLEQGERGVGRYAGVRNGGVVRHGLWWAPSYLSRIRLEHQCPI
jgi:hypothetical protein